MRNALVLALALAPLGFYPPAAVAQAAPSAASGVDFSQPAVRAPLSLDQAIAIALARSPQYQAARAAVDGAAAGVRQARAPFLPAVALRDDFLYADPVAKLETPFGPLPFATTTTTNVPLLVAQYTLYDGGAGAARFSQAAAGLSASEAGERQTRAALIAATSKAYFDLVASFRLAEVAEEAVALAAGHLRSAQQFYDAGQVPRADILRAQTELANERVNALGAENAVLLGQAALSDALHVPLASTFVPVDTLGAESNPPDLDGLVATAKTHRADLAAARASVEAAQHAVDRARAGDAPSLSAFVSNGNTQPAVVPGYHNQVSAGLNLVWTLFDNGYSAGGVAAAKAGVAQARAGLEQLESGVELQVREAYLLVKQAGAQVSAAQQLVAFADESLRLAQLRYRGGVGTALELQDAELRANSARQTLVAAQVALREGLVQLRFAAGLL